MKKLNCICFIIFSCLVIACKSSYHCPEKSLIGTELNETVFDNYSFVYFGIGNSMHKSFKVKTVDQEIIYVLDKNIISSIYYTDESKLTPEGYHIGTNINDIKENHISQEFDNGYGGHIISLRSGYKLYFSQFYDSVNKNVDFVFVD